MGPEEQSSAPQPTESEAIVAALQALPGASLASPVPLPVDLAAGLSLMEPDREKDHIAEASISLDAPIARVWEALITPALIKKYMFDTKVTSDWKEGDPITWEGVYEGKHYADKGVIIQCVSLRILQYTRYSPMSGEPDGAANHHTVSLELAEMGSKTVLKVRQDENPTEAARGHAAKSWREMFEGLKKIV